MLYIPKIDDYLEILTDDEVKDSAVINFSEYFKSVREGKNLREIAKPLQIFLTTPDEVEKYVQSNCSVNCVHHYDVEILNLSDLELQLINTKPVIKNQLKELLSELKRFKVKTKLALEYKKRNGRKIFHSSAKVIASDADIDEAFNKSMHQSIMTKIKNCASKDWIVLDIIIKYGFKIFEC